MSHIIIKWKYIFINWNQWNINSKLFTKLLCIWK